MKTHPLACVTLCYNASMKLFGQRTRQQWYAIAVAAVIVLGLFVYVVATLPEDFVFSEHLDDVAVTVTSPDGAVTEVSLREMSYYIMLSEANVNQLAEVYNSENTHQFWNIFTNHTFIKTKAKEEAYDSCIRDVIYVQEAVNANIMLTDEERTQADLRAQDIADGMTLKQQEVTRLTAEDLIPIIERITLAYKYANYLVDTVDDVYDRVDMMPKNDKVYEVYDKLAENYGKLIP